jgi:hypothetical protein
VKGYNHGLDVLGAELESVPSVCGVIMGGPQPYRGLAAGVLEVTAALFLPTALRVVVGSIGALRIGYGLYKVATRGETS